ncbi:MAG: M20/M25/M40 family metallo-hydrolase [Gemmatimonadaceae bacterium]
MPHTPPRTAPELAGEPLALALALMSLDSTSGGEGEVIARMEARLQGTGWRTTRIPVSPGRDALHATAVDDPLVTLSTHLDTVPPYIAPRVEGTRLYGRGACDAKGIAAAMVVAAEQLRAEGLPVALLFVIGEETTHDGAHAANAWAEARGGSGHALINGEPTESTLALGTKGAMRVVVRTEGEAAHSAYPELGRSATHALVHLLAELDALELPRDPLLGETTINIGALAGGVADNVIAPSAEARLMARIVGPAEALLAQLRDWAAGRASLEQGVTVPAVRLGGAEGFPTSVVAYATDVPNLPAFGVPFLFGPGSIHVAHRDDEHIELAELDAAVGAYVRLARSALERS